MYPKNNKMDCPLQLILDDDAAKIRLSCSHIFHRKCLTHCILQHRSCPLCRAYIETEGAGAGGAGAGGSDLYQLGTIVLILCLLILVLYNAITLRVQCHLYILAEIKI